MGVLGCGSRIRSPILEYGIIVVTDFDFYTPPPLRQCEK